MTAEELKQRFPRISDDCIRKTLAQDEAQRLNPRLYGPAAHKRAIENAEQQRTAAHQRVHTVIQNAEARHDKQNESGKGIRSNNHAPRSQKAYGRNHPRYRVTVNLTLAGRSSDPDGQLSTLLDCIVSASKRLRSVDS